MYTVYYVPSLVVLLVVGWGCARHVRPLYIVPGAALSVRVYRARPRHNSTTTHRFHSAGVAMEIERR